RASCAALETSRSVARLRRMAGSLLRRRDVRLIVSTVGVSSAGDFLLWVPLTLHLRAMHGSGFVVAGLFLALWTPIVVLAPAAGLLVDRLEACGVDRRIACAGGRVGLPRVRARLDYGDPRARRPARRRVLRRPAGGVRPRARDCRRRRPAQQDQR